MTSSGTRLTRRRFVTSICATAVAPADARTRVFSRISTPLGALVFELFPDRAPVTVANYLAYVDRGLLERASVYRILGRANQRRSAVPISVVQWGRDDAPGTVPPLPPIPHEPTSRSGLRHLDGTISMARLGPGTAAGEMFVCVGDQPALDEGGRRAPDGLGFAAFGRLTEGWATLGRLAALATETERLARPVPVYGVSHRRRPPASFEFHVERHRPG